MRSKVESLTVLRFLQQLSKLISQKK